VRVRALLLLLLLPLLPLSVCAHPKSVPRTRNVEEFGCQKLNAFASSVLEKIGLRLAPVPRFTFPAPYRD